MKKLAPGTFLKKIREAESTDQKHESGKAKDTRPEENVTNVNELVGLLSQVQVLKRM